MFAVHLLTETTTHITTPLTEQATAVLGETVTLEAEVSKPNVEGAWYKDEIELLPEMDDKYDVAVIDTKHELTIHEVTPRDEGEYALEVAGETTTTVLMVEGRLLLTANILLTHYMYYLIWLIYATH